jgi:hypothetical protein
MRRTAADVVDPRVLQGVPLAVRCAHRRRFSPTWADTHALVPMGEDVTSVLAGRRAPEVPARAKVALVDMQRDSRLELADIGGPLRLLLGPESGLWRPIGPPVRTERERAGVVAPASAPPLWKVAPAHHPILARN